MGTLPSDPISRRSFLRALASATAGTAIAPLGLLHARTAQASRQCQLIDHAGQGFGPLVPRVALNAEDLIQTVAGDLSKTPLLHLPPDFVYTAVSITGERMDDGSLVPGDHDGMACFRTRKGHNILVRNHELDPAENEFGNRAGVQPASGKVYDPFNLPAGQGGGGTTTLSIDRDGQLVEHFASLGGTIRNCAGGPTPWGSWISCEETTAIAFFDPRLTKPHGYCFEVPAHGPPVEPVPIVAAGRFNHEAVAVDPRTGILYETEDRGDSCFYRYVSNRRPRSYGHLQEGGSLYAMAIDPTLVAHCDGTPIPTFDAGGGVHAVDTRRGMRSFLGQRLPVRWVRLEGVNPFGDTVRLEARSKGASLIERGEGAWAHGRKIHFVATSGGDDDNGQIWRYDPRRETVTLIFESPASSVLDNPDNMTVAGDGTLYLCEDGGGGNSVVGIDARGGVFQFLRNGLDTSEFAGACFSPDNRFFFVNTQGLGVTFAVFRSDRRRIVAKPPSH